MASQHLSQWERAALTRWGRYITNLETQVLARAGQMIGRPGVVFDFGCGEGRWTSLLREKGWQAICGDIDEVALAKCAERNPGARCVPLTMGEDRFPVDDAAADLVLCIEVPGEGAWFRKELVRVLKPGGLVVGIFHNRDSARGLLRSVRDKQRGQYCFYQMGYSTWSSHMRAVGLDIVHAEGLCWFPFGRMSDSALIPASIGLERFLGLRALPSLSPWVAFIAVNSLVTAPNRSANEAQC
jgi:SAM-dependent methyltransferase